MGLKAYQFISCLRSPNIGDSCCGNDCCKASISSWVAPVVGACAAEEYIIIGRPKPAQVAGNVPGVSAALNIEEPIFPGFAASNAALVIRLPCFGLKNPLETASLLAASVAVTAANEVPAVVNALGFT